LKHLAHKYLSTFSQRAHPKKIFIHQPTRTRASTTLSCCTSRKAARKLQVVRQRRIVSATIFRSRAKSLVSSTRDAPTISIAASESLYPNSSALVASDSIIPIPVVAARPLLQAVGDLNIPPRAVDKGAAGMMRITSFERVRGSMPWHNPMRKTCRRDRLC
jgi:hypothetical protein